MSWRRIREEKKTHRNTTDDGDDAKTNNKRRYKRQIKREKKADKHKSTIEIVVWIASERTEKKLRRRFLKREKENEREMKLVKWIERCKSNKWDENLKFINNLLVFVRNRTIAVCHAVSHVLFWFCFCRSSFCYDLLLRHREREFKIIPQAFIKMSISFSKQLP